MNVTSINDGIVIDHIEAGSALKIYDLLDLGSLDCPVAIITNADSKKMGKKDLIKIDAPIEIDLDALGYVAPGVTVNTIKDGVLHKRRKLELPREIKDVIKCKNPRCITTTEQELHHIFKLTDEANRVYRCIYCESKAKTDK